MQTEYDIFISYSDKDRELARKVYEALKAEGLKCWIAFNDIPHGEVWAKAITQGIKNSKTFLLILSNNSNTSDQVLREIEYADKQKKKLYCYKVEELVVSDAIDYFISSIQQFEGYALPLEDFITGIKKDFNRSIKSDEKLEVEVPESKPLFSHQKGTIDKKENVIFNFVRNKETISFMLFFPFFSFSQNDTPIRILIDGEQKGEILGGEKATVLTDEGIHYIQFIADASIAVAGPQGNSFSYTDKLISEKFSENFLKNKVYHFDVNIVQDVFNNCKIKAKLHSSGIT